MGALAGSSDLERRLSRAEEELAEANSQLANYADQKPTKLLDPKTIRQSKWANRDAANFSGHDWEDFKAELASSGGNVQPIKVRRLPASQVEGQVQYEVVFGHRRHMGCYELDLSVLAMVEDEMTDGALFAEMDRENRQRQDLSAWEQGRNYNLALAEGLFSSQRQLSEQLGVNLSIVSRACAIAKMPDDVVKAFPSPLALQFRMAKPLGDKLQSDPDGVLQRARALHSRRGALSAPQVLEKLLNADSGVEANALTINAADGGQVATLRKGPKGRAVLEFEPGVLPPGRHQALMDLIGSFLKT
jgi:ParB family chromosome partitioning protein